MSQDDRDRPAHSGYVRDLPGTAKAVLGGYLAGLSNLREVSPQNAVFPVEIYNRIALGESVSTDGRIMMNARANWDFVPPALHLLTNLGIGEGLFWSWRPEEALERPLDPPPDPYNDIVGWVPDLYSPAEAEVWHSITTGLIQVAAEPEGARGRTDTSRGQRALMLTAGLILAGFVPGEVITDDYDVGVLRLLGEAGVDAFSTGYIMLAIYTAREALPAPEAERGVYLHAPDVRPDWLLEKIAAEEHQRWFEEDLADWTRQVEAEEAAEAAGLQMEWDAP